MKLQPNGRWRCTITMLLNNPDKGISLGRQVLLSLFCMIWYSYTSFFSVETLWFNTSFVNGIAREVDSRVASRWRHMFVWHQLNWCLVAQTAGVGWAGHGAGGGGRGRVWEREPVASLAHFRIIWSSFSPNNRWWYLQSKRFTSWLFPTVGKQLINHFLACPENMLIGCSRVHFPFCK